MKNKATFAKLTVIVLMFAFFVIISCNRGGGIGNTQTGTVQNLDTQLEKVLKDNQFTGSIESTLEKRLGRPLNKELAELGKLIFFDNFLGISETNSCAACHSPTAGMGDTQSIAIGVGSNNIVGPNRAGARNQRRTPTIVNTAFFPSLMWNGRFSAPTNDPFNNTQGYSFPPPEGTKEFPPNEPEVKHLLTAQGHIPPTEMPEMAGFNFPKKEKNFFFTTERFQQKALLSKDANVRQQSADSPNELKVQVFSNKLTNPEEPTFDQFDDNKGVELPAEEDIDGNITRNYAIRKVTLTRFNNSAEYKKLFAAIFPEVAQGKPITFRMLGQALFEFQMSLTFAKAPIDRFAMGEKTAMTDEQKQGALLFFGKANCATCHSVSGSANEMFSDFKNYNIGVPQIAPTFGKDKGNVPFRNQNGDLSNIGTQDFGLEDISGNQTDRYLFRTSPLRNAAVQQAFFHNGSFTRLDDAIRHHLNVAESVKNYDPVKAGVDSDIDKKADMTPVLATLDARLNTPINLSEQEFNALCAFVRDALLDERAKPENLKAVVPQSVPSGLPLAKFEF